MEYNSKQKLSRQTSRMQKDIYEDIYYGRCMDMKSGQYKGQR